MEISKEADDTAGMQWWNSLNEQARNHWLTEARSAVPAEAWKQFKQTASGAPQRPQEPFLAGDPTQPTNLP